MGLQRSQDSYQIFSRNPAECFHFNTLRVSSVFETRVRYLEKARPVLINLHSVSFLTNFGSSCV